jgi:hypothetical protein
MVPAAEAKIVRGKPCSTVSGADIAWDWVAMELALLSLRPCDLRVKQAPLLRGDPSIENKQLCLFCERHSSFPATPRTGTCEEFAYAIDQLKIRISIAGEST